MKSKIELFMLLVLFAISASEVYFVVKTKQLLSNKIKSQYEKSESINYLTYKNIQMHVIPTNAYVNTKKALAVLTEIKNNQKLPENKLKAVAQHEIEPRKIVRKVELIKEVDTMALKRRSRIKVTKEILNKKF